MQLTPARLNRYTFFKLPAAWWCGVRVVSLDELKCSAVVRLQWINKNPFRSMFWAVQGMAAELSTGVLLMNIVQQEQKNVSMLLLQSKATFTKKAKGKIEFSCDAGELVSSTMKRLFENDGPQTLWLQSKGIDAQGDCVATFDFEWTLLEKKIK